MISSKFLRHEECPCGKSSDGLAVYSDGGKYCWVCEKFFGGRLMEVEEKVDKTNPKELWNSAKVVEIKDRRISYNTALKYNVRCLINDDGEITDHLYPYYSNGKIVGIKRRHVEDKTFYAIGNMRRPSLFGMNAFPAGGKFITITEGEADAMSVYEMSGGQSAAISIKSSSSLKDFEDKAVYDYVDSFETIVLCLDNDDNGKKATEKLVDLFDPKKIRIVKFEAGMKDASDYCQAGRFKDFTTLWWRAEPYSPNGVVPASSLRGLLLDQTKSVCYETPYMGLNNITYGFRMSEMTTITAETGVGKSQIFYELIHHYATICDFNIAVIPLEAPLKEVLQKLAGIYLSKPIHLPDVEVSPQELLKADEVICGSNKLYFIEGFGSIDIDSLLRNIRFLVKSLNCKMVFLDHISMITSDQRYADERKALDEASTKLKMMTVELDMCLNIVAHLNREGQIRGTANIEKVSNNILRLERDKNSMDEYTRNVTKVFCEKNRFSGKTGPACALFYNEKTGRMEEVEWPADGDDI